MNLWVIFLTGLSIGGLTCLAVQGGLLASVITTREGENLRGADNKSHPIWPVGSFLIAKLIAYTILGFLLGAFGQALSLSDSVRIAIQIIAGLYMIAVALNLLNVHPIFRYVIIQPPHFITKFIRGRSKSKDLFAPALLGALTILIPCGTTLAMEALAISTGSALFGAAVMATFIIGTMPVFLGLGLLTSVLGKAFQEKFLKLAAIAVLYLGLSSINGGLILMGSPLTFQSLISAIPIEIDLSGEARSSSVNSVSLINGVQVAGITVLPTGYNPSYLQVQAGVPVKLNLTTSGGLGCTSVFRIPQLKISKNLPLTGSSSLEFTPTSRGKLTWTCSMGMYSGTIEVI